MAEGKRSTGKRSTARRSSGKRSRSGPKRFLSPNYKTGENVPSFAKNKPGGGDRQIPKFFKDAQKAAYGLPTGLYNTGKVLTTPTLKDDWSMLKGIGKQSYEDVRHPGRSPFNTLMTLLGVASMGGGTTARAATAGKTYKKTGSLKKSVKAAGRKPAYTRSFSGVPTAPGRFPKRYQNIPASPNPLLRGARKITLDPAFRASAKRAVPTKENPKGKRGGGYAKWQERRHADERARYVKQSQSGSPETAPTEKPRSDVPDPGKVALDLYGLPMNAMRAAMVLRPRYFLQNLASSGLMLGMEPINTAKSINTARKLRKNLPETPKKARASMGDPGTGAAATEAVGYGAKATRKMAHLANAPEARLRELAFYNAARKAGITSPAAIQRLLAHPETSKFYQVAKMANESMVDYARLGNRERAFMRSGIPIFYPMTKGFARYGARFPSEHSILSALGANIGTQGFESQQSEEEGFGGPLPPWSPYMIKHGEDTTLNPQNIYPFSPLSDSARQVASPFKTGLPRPGETLLSNAGPNAETLYGLLGGLQLQTGYKLPGIEEGSPFSSTLKELLHTLPFSEFYNPRETKAYGKPTLVDLLMLSALGPAFYPRKTKMSVLRQQGRKQNPR